MAERTVSVKLIADAAAYVRGMDEAVRKTKDSTQSIEQQLQQQAQAYQLVGTAAIGVGVASLAGVTAAVVAYSQFDAAMSNVQAATGETSSNMALLSEAALQAGADTVYSATESAAAIEELSKAGVSTADILGGGLTGSLNLAAAGEIAVADAAEVASSAMTQFGLGGEDVTHIADLLAAAAGNAQGGVADMGAALSQSGLVAAQMGLSIEETTGTLAAFASAGLLGSDAGTSFRAMLLRLANPTGEVNDVMRELGLSFYDAQGQFIGMEGVASQLTTQMADLTQEQRNQALATIFGQDAIRAASILYEEGAEGVAEWTATVNDSGYAAEQAAARLDNLQGDLEALGGAFETLLINLGSSADGPLRGLVQLMDDLVSAAAGAPPELQAVALGTMAVVGAVALAGGAAVVALPQIVAFQGALVTLGITAAGTRAALLSMLGNPLLVAAAATAAAIMVVNDVAEQSRASVDEWAAAVEGGATALELFAIAGQGNEGLAFQGFQFDASEFESYLDSVERIRDNPLASLDPSTWAQQMSNFASSLREVDAALAAADPSVMVDGFNDIVDQYNLSEDAAVQLLGEMTEVREELVNQAIAADPAVGAMSELEQTQAAYAIATGDAAEASEGATGALTDMAAETQSATEAALELLDAQRAIVDAFFESQDATAAYEQTIDDIAEAMADGLSPAINQMTGDFDLGEQSGRDAAAMMQELVSSASDVSDQLLVAGASSGELAAQQAYARDQIYQTGLRMGLSEDQAREYANMLVEIPDSVSTLVNLSTSAAESAMAAFLNQRRVVVVDVDLSTAGAQISGATLQGGNVVAFNSGGRIPGPYLGYDDRLGFDQHGNVYGLAGDEWIINAAQSSKWDHVLRSINDGTFVGYDSGGRVGSPYGAYASAPQVVFVDRQSGSMAPVNVGVTVSPERDPVIAGRQFGRGVSEGMYGTGRR